MRTVYILALFVLACTACRFTQYGERIKGNGNITTKDRGITSFSSVDASGAIQVHIIQGNATSVKIETDENIQPYIEVYTQGNTLIIRNKERFEPQPTKDVIAYVTAPALNSIEVAGACDISGDGPYTANNALELHTSGSSDVHMEVMVPKLTVETAGSGKVQLKGRANEFVATVSGSGEIKCFELSTDTTKLDLAGSADAEVMADKKLDIDASGSSSIKYKGAANLTQNISGSGSVKKVD